jgi:hypothetical protein
MDIRIVSSLTSDDEDVVAPALMAAIAALLAALPIAYALRIVTTDGRVWQQVNIDDSLDQTAH